MKEMREGEMKDMKGRHKEAGKERGKDEKGRGKKKGRGKGEEERLQYTKSYLRENSVVVGERLLNSL